MTWRLSGGDASGAVADLGVLVPLAAALILVNGLAPAPVLAGAGALYVAAGLWSGIPFPVQPLKALTALAVAQHLSPDVIHAAGLLIGLVLVALTVTGLSDRLARLFTKPVIRALQLAVGSLLVVSAFRLAVEPPAVFRFAPPAGWSLVLAAATVVVVAIAAWRGWHALAAILVLVGTAVAWVIASPELGAVAVHRFTFTLPPAAVWGTAFVVLVVPQLPLTYGNAVVGVSDLAREQFPDAPVTPGRVAVSCGVGNIAAALIGGMPMCHGSSGFSAHVRLGARTPVMNLLLGAVLLTLGVVFSAQVLAVFGLLPIWALAGFLAYAGVRHAMLALDLTRAQLVVAVIAASAGVVTRNLVTTTVIALAVEWLPPLRRLAAPAPQAGDSSRRAATSRSSVI